MPRAACTFRQTDVRRAIRAAFAAGAVRARIEVGDMVVIAEKSEVGQIVTGTAAERDYERWKASRAHSS